MTWCPGAQEASFSNLWHGRPGGAAIPIMRHRWMSARRRCLWHLLHRHQPHCITCSCPSITEDDLHESRDGRNMDRNMQCYGVSDRDLNRKTSSVKRKKSLCTSQMVSTILICFRRESTWRGRRGERVGGHAKHMQRKAHPGGQKPLYWYWFLN